MSDQICLEPPAWLVYDRKQAELAREQLLSWPQYDAARQVATTWFGHRSSPRSCAGDVEALSTHLGRAGHSDIAAALSRGEDYPAVDWLVGEAWADALDARISLETWVDARDWIGRHRIAYLAFDCRLRERVASDGALADRLVALADDVIGRVAADIGAAARFSSDRSALSRTVEHWLRPVDPTKEWHEAPTLHELWGGFTATTSFRAMPIMGS